MVVVVVGVKEVADRRLYECDDRIQRAREKKKRHRQKEALFLGLLTRILAYIELLDQRTG